MNQNTFGSVTAKQLVGLMLLAYIFSFAVRLIWVYQFKDDPNFYWNGQLMINNNDGYYWASGVVSALEGLHHANPRVPGLWSGATVFVTAFLAKFTPMSIETATLYMPAIISSLVVIPIILIARLFGQTFWGFLAALLGSIAWSYYNRTMIGYYDTDMFSAMAPMFILYFLMKSTVDFNLRSALYAALAIVIYPLLYDQGQAIVYAMGIIYALYLVVFHPKNETTYSSLILVFLALLPMRQFGLTPPMTYVASLGLVLVAYGILQKVSIDQKRLIIVSGVLFVLFLLLGNVFGLIWHKIFSYTVRGTEGQGLHFYAVNQTVREAGKTLFFSPVNGAYQTNIADRMMGSNLGLLVALIGYLALVWRNRAFLLALPLIGIGIFAHWGGLRFTVYAVPVAAMSAVYLFVLFAEQLRDKKAQYALVIVATAAMLYPNIKHIIAYKVPTVFNKAEVQDLAKLDKIASPDDYTLTWWDYGYPIWYYSDTSTLIDGGKHDNDNFIISTVLQTDSPTLAANLSRLAVETYVDSNHSVVSDALFRNGKQDQKDPNLILDQLENDAYKLPKKTRDVYLYLPYRMMGIFPTVAVFGNLDLTTGKPKRKITFYPTSVARNQGEMVQLRNGMVLDLKHGDALLGKEKVPLQAMYVTTNDASGAIRVQKQPYHLDGKLIAVYMKSYGRMVVMDPKTFRSTYIQMFVLGRYDPKLFESVVVSPYSRIYKLKR